MPWFGMLPPSEHYSLDYVHYSLLGNPVRVRIQPAAYSLETTNVRQVSASFGIKGLHFIYPFLNRGVTAAVGGGGGDNAWISWPKHP